MVTPVQSPVTFGGRCYLTTAAGAIVVLDLNPGAQWPLMTFVLDEDPPVNTETSSFLVRSQGRMLVVRYMFGAILLEEGGYGETEILMWARSPPHVEVFEVDVAGRRLVAKSGIDDNHTAFLRKAHSFMVSTKKFTRLPLIRCISTILCNNMVILVPTTSEIIRLPRRDSTGVKMAGFTLVLPTGSWKIIWSVMSRWIIIRTIRVNGVIPVNLSSIISSWLNFKQ
jgi:hypothetical protein